MPSRGQRGLAGGREARASAPRPGSRPVRAAHPHHQARHETRDRPRQPAGHIQVWVKDGRLASMDYSWFAEEPINYPPPDRLAPWDPVTSSSFPTTIAGGAIGRLVLAAVRAAAA